MPTHKYHLPNAGDWTRWDEIKQRVGNCRRFLGFAWLGLTTDSATFAVCVINGFREAGDGLIAATMKDGRLIDPDNIESKNP